MVTVRSGLTEAVREQSGTSLWKKLQSRRWIFQSKALMLQWTLLVSPLHPCEVHCGIIACDRSGDQRRKSHWLHRFQSSNWQLIFPPVVLSQSQPYELLCLKPKLTCFLCVSVYCIEVHHKKLLSGKNFAVHTAKRKNVLHISFFVHQSRISHWCWQLLPKHCFFWFTKYFTAASLQKR